MVLLYAAELQEQIPPLPTRTLGASPRGGLAISVPPGPAGADWPTIFVDARRPAIGW